MAKRAGGLLDRVLHKRMVRHWAKATREAASADAGTLRPQRARARQLKTHLDDFLHTAEGQLAMPRNGAPSLRKPFDADWGWRPEFWRGPLTVPGLSSVPGKSTLGGQISLFHDCPYAEVTLRQLRNLRNDDLAPYGLALEVFEFGGSFLSISLDLPQAATDGLTKSHLIRLETQVEIERDVDIFARLSVKHGPDTEQLVRQLPMQSVQNNVEFDLAYSKLDEQRVEKAWLDLSFDGPAMNQIVLRDMAVFRRPRASF